MYQQLWGYKVEEKLYLGVREQIRLNTTVIHIQYILKTRARSRELDGPESVEVVSLDEGHGLEQLSTFICAFLNSFPSLSTHADVPSGHNMRQFLHFYSVKQF
jgi:hypothetical protein